MTKSRRGQAGFTVLEALLATSVLLVGLSTFASLANETLDGGLLSRHVNAASNLARDKMEEMRAAPYASLTSGADASRLDAEGSTSGAHSIYSRSWTIAAGPTSNTKLVTIEVAWDEAGAKKVQLETIVLDW